MGWFRNFCLHMAKVKSRPEILVNIKLTYYYREQRKQALVSPQESSDEETDTVVVDGTPTLKN